MSVYSDLIQSHASKVFGIYKAKMPEIMSQSGLVIAPDGSNNASKVEDITKYLNALRQVCGNVSYTSGKLVIIAAAQSKNIPLPGIG